MSYPPTYNPDYSFTAFSQSQGDNSFPGTQIDNELAMLRASVDGLVVSWSGAFSAEGILKPGKTADSEDFSVAIEEAEAAAAAAGLSADAAAASSAAATISASSASGSAASATASAASADASKTAAAASAALFPALAATQYLRGNAGGTAWETRTAAQTRTDLGLVIGTNVQAFDTDLTAIAALVSVADRVPYATGTGTWALTALTAAARTVLDDTTVGAMLTTLGGMPLAGGNFSGLVSQSAGNGVVVGGSALVAGVYAGGAITPPLQTQAAGATGFATFRAGASASPPIFGLFKTRGASASAHTAVNTSDQLGAFSFGGSDGTAYRDGLRLIATVTGAPTATNVPTRFDALTGDGTSSFVGLGQDQNGNLQVNQATVVTQARHIQLRSYTVATLPSAATAAQLIFVSDGTSNKRLAVSDGTNWRWPDGAVVS